MRALVTGVTGCVGRAVAAKLVEEGFDVSGTATSLSYAGALTRQGVRLLVCDVRDPGSVLSAIEGADVVVHSAALTSPWARPADFEAVNVVGTRNVAAACLASGVKRLVHVSSPSIYFGFEERHGITEQDKYPERQANAYSLSKLRSETVVDAAGSRGLETVTVRPRAVFGPYDRAIFPRLLAASRGGRVPLVGGGAALIDVTCADNVAEAVFLAATTAGIGGRKYNITNGHPVTVRDLAEKAFRAVRLPFAPVSVPYRTAHAVGALLEAASRLTGYRFEPRITAYAAGVMNFGQTFDISKARAELGYVPRVSLEEGLARFRSWWLARNEA